jgi:hypothetical protein
MFDWPSAEDGFGVALPNPRSEQLSEGYSDIERTEIPGDPDFAPSVD